MISSATIPAAPGNSVEPPTYYLLWRTRPSHPWHSEEFSTRIEAHRRYFALLERGLEVYLERRHRATLPA
jgi:hypothetical protein